MGRNVERDKGLKVTKCILQLSAERLKVEEAKETPETDADLLLAIVLANIKQETLTFQKKKCANNVRRLEG